MENIVLHIQSFMVEWREVFIQWGYPGLFLSALLSGSIIPFSSEIVLLTLVGLGLDPFWCVLWASIGNTIGGMTCYWMGYAGKVEWVERYAHISYSKVEKMEARMQKHGAYMAFFCFLPVLGEVIGVALGFMRANALITCSSMFVGKLIRYIALTIPLLYAVDSVWQLVKNY